MLRSHLLCDDVRGEGSGSLKTGPHDEALLKPRSRGKGPSTANASACPGSCSTIGERDLERELLRKATVALRESSTRCRDCGRTPLTGERVHIYTRGHRVCELAGRCAGKPPERSERVRGGESGATVRVQVAAR